MPIRSYKYVHYKKKTLVQVKNDLVCADYIVDVVNSSNIFPKDRRPYVLSSKMPSLTKKQVRLWNLAEQYIIYIYIYTYKIISYHIYIIISYYHILSHIVSVCVRPQEIHLPTEKTTWFYPVHLRSLPGLSEK